MMRGVVPLVFFALLLAAQVPPTGLVAGQDFFRGVNCTTPSGNLSLRFPLTALRVDGVYGGNGSAIIVIDYEVLSPGMCPGNSLNCTLGPDMVAYYLFYVSSSGPYFLGAYPEEPVVRFEGNAWKLRLQLWNSSVENATFKPSCLNASNVSPVEMPNASLSWKTVKTGKLTITYPTELLGFSDNHTAGITNYMVKKVLPYVPFIVGVNGKFYPLFKPSNGTLLPVPPRVNPNLNCTPHSPTGTSTTKGENREICGPGVILLLAMLSLILFRKTGGNDL